MHFDISIVMPVRNATTTLPDCLDSICRQTRRDVELVAIDDGSDDDSVALMEAWRERLPALTLLTPGRIGLVAALNLGLAHSRGDIIIRMDADDIMHPQRVQQQIDYLTAHPDIALVGSQVRLFPDQHIKRGYREYIDWQNRCLTPQQIRQQIYVESPFAHPSVAFRKRAIMPLGGYREGEFPEDYDLWLRLHQAGCPMAKLDSVLLHWRDQPGRTSRTDPRYSRDAFDQLRAQYLAQDPCIPRDRPLVYWGAGRKTRLRAGHLIRQGFSASAWIDIDPRKIGNLVNGTPVHPPEWLDQPDKPFVLNYVNNYGAREQIASQLHSYGYQPERDYLMVG